MLLLSREKVKDERVISGASLVQRHLRMPLADQKKEARTYVLFTHDVVEGQLGAPGPLGERRPAVPPVRGAHCLLDNVFGQRQQTVLRLLN